MLVEQRACLLAHPLTALKVASVLSICTTCFNNQQVHEDAQNYLFPNHVREMAYFVVLTFIGI